MPREVLDVDGLVLEIADSGEHYRRLFVLTAAHGVLLCMLRVSRKAGTPRPDLFDDADMHLERNSGGVWFIREYQTRRTRKALARSYHAFDKACAFAAILKANYRTPGCHPAALGLGRKILDHLVDSPHPELIFLKGLFILARAEGYPVEQEWLAEQAAALRRKHTDMLNLPVREQSASPQDVAQAEKSLLAYLRHSTDIRLPDRSQTGAAGT